MNDLITVDFPSKELAGRYYTLDGKREIKSDVYRKAVCFSGDIDLSKEEIRHLIEKSNSLTNSMNAIKQLLNPIL
jgi:hypothetical protein